MGIAEYNKQCRNIVMRYSNEWEVTVKRMGRWIDFKNDYKTLYPWFMETVWWVFKQLYDKGFVYRGFKVMPFSTACNTPLSNFESNQNYKDVKDPSVIVSFPLVEDENVALIAWTTTPWTLPSNLALCVNPDFLYVKVKVVRCYFLFPGKTLKGKKYKPLFQYFAKCGEKGAFQVLTDNYVKEEEGTGVVHQAPYFGTDDYRVCSDYNIIQKDQSPICPVDASGCFTSEVTDFAGQYVKVSDTSYIYMQIKFADVSAILLFLKATGTILRINGSIILIAVLNWHFIFYSGCSLSSLFLTGNLVPEFVREKRFGNWLRDARDWAISRNRYWGTPIPLWVSDDFEEVVCIGSMAELEELTGVKVTDLHRESIESLTIPSRCGKGELRRVSEVFDCWFESGSMPYAQIHYPFENRKEFEDTFPADFIAEGIDQTRGWFYTLLVLSTALFGKPPFKNVIVNGLVLARSFKMCSFRFKWLMLWFLLFVTISQEDNIQFLYNENTMKHSDNIMDKWIQSFTQSLIQFFKAEMAAYRLYTVVPRLVKFVDMLTNWYVRTNRRRLKGESGTEDCLWALETLFSVLFSMCRLMAPFTPFITEMMYQNLRHLIDPSSTEEKDTNSIHYLMLPQVRESLIDKRIESAVSQMQSVIELGRVIRDRKTLPVKYPLKEVVVIHQDPEALKDIQSLQKYILEELNVRQLTLSTDKDKYGIRLRAEPDHMVLGKRLKGGFKAVTASIKELTNEQLEAFQKTGSIVVDGHELHEEDLRLMYTFDQSSGSAAQYEAHSDAQVLVLLDVTPDQSMVDEGVAREVINRIQKLRKKGHLVPSDEITVYYRCQPEGEYLASVVHAHTDFILATTKAPLLPFPVPDTASVIIKEKTQLKGSDLELTIVKGSTSPRVSLNGPACRYVNLRVKVNNKEQGVVLLENPKGDNRLDLDKLRKVCSSIFGTTNTPLKFFINGTELTSKMDLEAQSGKTLYVTSDPSCTAPGSTADTLLSPYVNLLLCNAQPGECQAGDVGTLLLVNPAGQNVLDYSGLLSEAAKIFGLRSRRLKLYLDQDLTQELPADSSVKSLNTKTLFVRVLATTAEV
uniref:isoleucine--tRNA ligase n=1 Tax=Kryptolebias marmoratus TaxID=37003 RepID=A0A3Q3AFX2_KRYMA